MTIKIVKILALTIPNEKEKIKTVWLLFDLCAELKGNKNEAVR